MKRALKVALYNLSGIVCNTASVNRNSNVNSMVREASDFFFIYFQILDSNRVLHSSGRLFYIPFKLVMFFVCISWCSSGKEDLLILITSLGVRNGMQVFVGRH